MKPLMKSLLAIASLSLCLGMGGARAQSGCLGVAAERIDQGFGDHPEGLRFTNHCPQTVYVTWMWFTQGFTSRGGSTYIDPGRSDTATPLLNRDGRVGGGDAAYGRLQYLGVYFQTDAVCRGQMAAMVRNMSGR